MSGASKQKWLVVVAVVAVLGAVVAAVGQQQGGGGRGFGGNAVFGTVGAVDLNRGVIGVQGQNGQQTWVAVTAETQMTRLQEATAADLAVGDSVVVMGQPTAITARGIQIGEAGMGMGPGGPGGAGAPGGAGPAAGAPGGAPDAGGRRGGQMGGAMVTGQITAMEPLSVTTQDGTVVSVTVAPDARFIKSVQATIQNVVVGDQVMAGGQAGQDGFYYARNVRIGNVQGLGGFGGFGGFGGRGGGGRRGGGGDGGGG